MKRNIEKTTSEGRAILADRRKSVGASVCISAGEMTVFLERLQKEHPIEVLYDMWLFGFAVGHRAGQRDAKRKGSARN